MAKPRYVLVIKEKSIISFIGIDYDLVKKTDDDNLLKFYLSGALVVLILLVSFVSVFYGFELMFNMWHAELLLSLFFSFMFCNIYIFLIQTFSKEVFPTTYKLKFFNLSNLSRIGFVLLIGFLIAQPVSIFFLRDRLEGDIASYKTDLYQHFCSTNKKLYQADVTKLSVQKNAYLSIGESASMQDQIAKIDAQLQKIDDQIKTANEIALDKIKRSEFFIKRIEIAGRYPLGQLINIIVLVIFCAPLFLIYSISGNSRYYKLKKQRDKALVVQEYQNFKKQYTDLFLYKHGISGVYFYEPYLDPPFNSKRKIKPVCLSQDNFFNNLNQI